MAIITIPASPQKGQSQSYSLNVTELNTLVSDNYFKDQNNLALIEVVYQSSVGNQLEAIKFIPNGSMSLSANAEFSAKARDLFGIQSISLVDKQNGRYQIKASEIPSVASYNINFNTASAILGFELFQEYQQFSPSINPTMLYRIDETFATLSAAVDTNSLGSMSNGVANYDVTFEFEDLTSFTWYGIYFGIVGSSMPPQSITLDYIFSPQDYYKTNGIVLNISSGGLINTNLFNTGDNGVTVPAGSSKKIRILQENSNTIKFYNNDVLVLTSTINNSPAYSYLYPILRGNVKYKLVKATNNLA